jgi:hypothetical protein
VRPFFYFLMLIGGPVVAQDTSLSALKTTLLALRPHHDELRDTRDATPQLTIVKHQFRDWIESHLPSLSPSGGDRALLATLHAGLRDAQLFCADECVPSYLGFVDDVQIQREREFLIVQTGVGIRCGYDESAYVYTWSGGAWKRIFSSEQNVYTKEAYQPQTIHGVHISEPDSSASRLVLTLGSKPGCSSAFQPVYWRVYRVTDGASKLLLEDSKFSNVSDYEPIRGSVTAAGATVSFSLGGTGWGFPWNAVRSYSLLQNGQLKQTGATVLTPRDFVEEWLDSTGKREDGAGDFPDPPLRCGHSELWQITTRLTRDPQKTSFLVEWKQPYQFRMVQVSQEAEALCPRQ